MSDIDSRTQVLEGIAHALTDRFGNDLLIRIGPSVDWGRPTVALQVFAPNTSAAPVTLELDELEAWLVIGESQDCILFERRSMDQDLSRWAVQRITAVGERGLEMWRDSRRHLFGGQNQARIVGEDFVDLTDKRRARLSLTLTTEPWDRRNSTDLEDPVPVSERRGTGFLVAATLPVAVQRIAIAARQEFRAGISIVTRMGELGGELLIEILPTDRQATRMRVRELSASSLGISTGDWQYFEYEFDTVPLAESEQRMLDIGRLGLLETTVSRGRIYWFVNGPATPEAIAKADSNPRVSDLAVWKSWMPSS